MDHPRLRGEKWSSCFFWVMSLGSPPLARGKEGCNIFLCDFSRITPACAGKSRHRGDGQPVRRDHPRLRGEKTVDPRFLELVLGSPPLARGKVHEIHHGIYPPGITPACAGKSSSSRFQGHFRGDHPRLRGEKLVRIHHHLAIQGSPPLARGKVLQ